MDGVAGWFERRGEIPLAPPLGLREYGPLADDPDLPDADFSDDAIRGVSFALEYCDSRGWISTRTIRCLGIDPRAPVSLKAYCSVRRTSRTFRIDRIISIADLRTGAILRSDDHIGLLAPYLPDREPSLDVQLLAGLQHATKDGVFALLQLAMPNGRLGDRSREIVLDYVRAEAVAAGRVLPPMENVELWVDNLAPPLESVVAAIARLLKEKDKFVRLLPWLLKVVRSRETFAVQEESLRDLIAEVRLHFRRKLMELPAHSRATR